jgi:hypothetical protein
VTDDEDIKRVVRRLEGGYDAEINDMVARYLQAATEDDKVAICKEFFLWSRKIMEENTVTYYKKHVATCPSYMRMAACGMGDFFLSSQYQELIEQWEKEGRQ